VFSSSRRLLCNHAKINFQTLAWWNIWPIALFGMPAPEKIGTAKVFFFPLPPLQPNTTPKKKSSGGMVEYLAYSFVWNACA